MGTRSSIWAALRQLVGPWWIFVPTGLVWLIISVIVRRFAIASVALVGVVVLLCAFGEFRIASAMSGLPLRRRLAGYALAGVLAPVLTLLLAGLRGRLNPTTDALAFLVAVIAVGTMEPEETPGGGLGRRIRCWRAAGMVSPAPDGQSRGVTWHGLRRLRRETPHGHVG